MGFVTEKASNANRSMGLLLVFFPEQNNDRNGLLSLPSSSSSTLSSSSSSSPIRRTKSSSLILTKTQSTLSICFFFLLLTLFLFTLSTFEPTVPSRFTSIRTQQRRFLIARNAASNHKKPVSSFALQGMGTLFLRGTRAMQELLVAHVNDDVTGQELRLFLRLIHRSGITAKSDVIFLFPSGSAIRRFGELIREENESFFRLLDSYRHSNSSIRVEASLGFKLSPFLKQWKTDAVEPIWGRRSGKAVNKSMADGSFRVSHGSLLGFEANELDPENSLSGFLGNVNMKMRRWACYPMLLGRVRHNFKHLMLIDAKSSLVIGDPLRQVRSRGADAVLVYPQHFKRNSQTNRAVNPSVVVGGAKGVRRLSKAMLTEVVRATMQHKKKNSVSESGVMSQLVGNIHIAKNFHVIVSGESLPDSSALGVSASKDRSSCADCGIIERGKSNHEDLISVVMSQVCSNTVDSSVYRDC